MKPVAPVIFGYKFSKIPSELRGRGLGTDEDELSCRGSAIVVDS